MRWMNEPKHHLTEPASVSVKTLKWTPFECDANPKRELPEEQLDILEIVDRTTSDQRETQALARA